MRAPSCIYVHAFPYGSFSSALLGQLVATEESSVWRPFNLSFRPGTLNRVPAPRAGKVLRNVLLNPGFLRHRVLFHLPHLAGDSAPLF